MKYYNLLTLIFLLALIQGCGTSSKTSSSEQQQFNIDTYVDGTPFEIDVTSGKGHNHPTFVIWLEDVEGNFLKTIFITKSYASGIYGHAALTDSTWSNKSGQSYRPASLPYWSFKKGFIDGKFLIPEKEHPYVDGFTGATPKGDFSIESQLPKDGKYRILLEVNQTWDWNRYWTNNKYPDNRDYKSSAQPSAIYAVTVDINDPMPFYIMNPIGHGQYAGEDGRLYTDLSTMTTALEIFDRIEVKIK
ncbi:hypothetical protein ACE01N_03870 [Saccharicrinis sp. FJH2]|uniref:hypothetical protein n=1 Tax=Saccharicrinis sp. FJH65 TaxID=3344659 RepID=UPI0035F2446D